jgi:hypothetical protein
MSKKKDAMFTTILKKDGGKLTYAIPADEKIYKIFVDALEEGQRVELFFDANKDDGTLAQLAKIYKCMRELSKETGALFEDVKLDVKRKAGLCFVKLIDDEKYMFCKSLADCSKEDLGLVIETIISLGENVNINFR